MAGVALAVIGVAAGLGKVVGGIIGNSKSKRAARAAAAEKARIERQITNIENNRQAVINPYAGVTSVADMAENLSSQMSNPMANLGVATQAAEIQMEQTDIALANTLDTLQATGASAGGATALAQAAARSKKDVAASIETQEAANEKLRAQGEENLNRLKVSEGARVQGLQIAEGNREQMANAQGRAFEFTSQENRDNMQLNRMAGQEAQARMDISTQNANMDAAISAGISGVSSGLQAGALMVNSNKQAKLTRENDEKIAKLYN